MGVPVQKLGMSARSKHAKLGMGWLRDRPDIRDYTMKTKQVTDLLEHKKLKMGRIPKNLKLPESCDLRRWCTLIDDQGELGSCTANAGVGLIEYFEKAASGNWIDASRLFLYKTTRNLMGLMGDTGAELRTTMGAMVTFGVPPDAYWPYDISLFDVEPSAFLYAFANNYRPIVYFRFDLPGMILDDVLKSIKTFLHAGLPSMFGFTVYDSIYQAGADGMIPYPDPDTENIVGGHAMDAVGYDDNIQITNETSGRTTTGALLVRNSWGVEWGIAGYGWLPYDYVLSGLAADWWTILNETWIETGEFGL